MNIKIKLAALWATVTLCYLYGDYFELYTPDKVNDLISGGTTMGGPIKLLTASIVLASPALMVAAPILLKPVPNRLLNISFGSLFTLIMTFLGITTLTEWYSFYVFLAFLESGITLLIVFYVWKWPRQVS